MKISQVYRDYMTPDNLCEHMLKVGAVAKMIIDNWFGKQIDKEAIIQTCLLHDIAKPVNFDLKKQAKYGMKAEDIKNLEVLQNRIREEFGDDEHKATVEICREVGCSAKSLEMTNNIEWYLIPELIKKGDMDSLVCIYCDMRVGPEGILTLKKRLNNLKERTGYQRYDEHLKYGYILEQTISQNTKINVLSINDDMASKYLEPLREREII